FAVGTRGVVVIFGQLGTLTFICLFQPILPNIINNIRKQLLSDTKNNLKKLAKIFTKTFSRKLERRNAAVAAFLLFDFFLTLPLCRAFCQFSCKVRTSLRYPILTM
ncbi:hypothetical protein, partial [Lactobacillus equicursoris]|uniref:hypothetical protein n=1 Tax=Lactobacillus equicursoris TaxID=420645 RepID=UPI003995D158